MEFLINDYFGVLFFTHASVSLEDPGWRKFTQLVTHHVLGNIHIGKNLSAVDHKGKSYEIRCYHGAAAPCFNWLLIALGDRSVDLGQEFLVNERTFLEGTWHDSEWLTLLGLAALDDKLVAPLVLGACPLPLGVSPGGFQMLSPTTGLGLALSASIRMVDRVHTHSTHRRAHSLPAGPTRFSRNLIHVIPVPDLADGAIAILMKTPDFTRGHFNECVSTFPVRNHGLLASRASYLAPSPRTQPRGTLLRGMALPGEGGTLSPACTVAPT